MMTRFLPAIPLAISLCFAQPSAPAPAFEVASVKPVPPGTPANPGEHSGTVQLIYPGGRFQAQAVSLTYLFEWAYDLQTPQHSRMPAPFDTQRFDIVAQAGSGATETSMKLMLRALLAERFQLRYHVEQRELPVFIVTTGKTPPRFLPASPDGPRSVQMARAQGPSQDLPVTRVTGVRFTVPALLDIFARQFNRPMLDRTDTNKEFDFVLEIAPDPARPNVIDEPILLAALREQLNLQIKADKALVDYYVIDSVEAPAAN